MYRFLLATLLCSACASPALASLPQSSVSTPAVQVMQVDTPYQTVNGSRFIAPKRWSLQASGNAMILGAPEGDSHIAFVDVSGGDADAAVVAAWAAYRPGPLPPLLRTSDGTARDGWDQIRSYRYQAPDDVARTVSATARRKGDQWTVSIYDVTDPVAEKRDSQLDLMFGKHFPAGYEPESFSGRLANRLDARRIAMLTDFIEMAREGGNIPGLALGLIQDGQIVFAGGFGVRELGKPEPVDAHTLFNIASNGKPLTTLMLARLVDEGRFDWDTPVSSVWPEFRLGDPETTRQVLVRHLVCACTGLPRQDFQWLFEGENATAATTMHELATMQPTSEFGELYQYSNVLAAAGGFFGGHVLHPERELGSAYDTAMQDLVYGPLGMTATTDDIERARAGNFATGHDFDVDGNIAVASLDLHYAALSTRPSGAAWSNVHDMLRYVQMELARGVLPDGQRYISSDTLLERSEPQVAAESDEYYGMGLKIETRSGVSLIHHGGSMPGYISDVMWLPEHGVGAVILTNSYTGSLLRSAFRRRLLEVLFDGEPQAVQTLQSVAPRVMAGPVAERETLTVPADPAAVNGLAQRYVSPELGELVVRQQDGATVFDFGGWASEVATRRDEDGTLTFITIKPGADGFEFVVADEGGERRLIIREAQHQYAFTEAR